ncbi:MAG: glycosyltransferase [Candidatus Brockarchaeota archaeon]|nr:glycosyltransferase [Candidatus Brockarchaeota archaeon]MBO3810166.1 glycosyltransferase [Candidatus Brockarchaeota archaeon]
MDARNRCAVIPYYHDLRTVDSSDEDLTPSISLIMPAYELEDRIAEAIEKVEKTVSTITDEYEIIVVDDGSKDKTYRRALTRAENPHIRVYRHPVNLGKGAAIRTGVMNATMEYTVFLDADMDVDPGGLRKIVKALRSGDIVVCSKRHPGSVYRAPFMRKLLSVSFNTLVKLLMGIRLGDTQTGFKAFRTEALRRIMGAIVVKRYAFDVEVLAIANMLKMRIVEAPVRIEQKSMFSFKAAMQMLIDIMGIFYRLRVLRWYQRNLNAYVNTPIGEDIYYGTQHS